MRKEILLISLLLLSVLPMICAENGIEIIINNQSISIRGYTLDALYGKVDFGFFQKINESISNIIQCDNFTVNSTNLTYQTNCRTSLTYSKNIPIFTQNESSSTIIGDTNLYTQLIDCEILKAQYNAGLNTCTEAKNQQGDFSQNFTQCNTNIQICRSDKSNLEKEITDLKKDIEDNKNRQWWFLAIGLVVGGVGIMIKEGKIGAPKTKGDDETFNRGQAT